MQVQNGNDSELNFRATQITSGDGVISDFATYCNTPNLNTIVQSNSTNLEWNLTQFIGKPIKIFSTDLSSYQNYSFNKQVTVGSVLADHDILNIIENTFGHISLNVQYTFEIQSVYQHKGLLGVFSIPFPNGMLWTNGLWTNSGIWSTPPINLFKKIQCMEIPMGTSTTHVLSIPWNSVYAKHAPFGVAMDESTSVQSPTTRRITTFDPFLVEFTLGWIDNLVAVAGVDLKARLNIISEITSINYSGYCNVAAERS
jgi:hypothetical protein